MTLNKHYSSDNNIFEIGIDEAGRGPLFGRVYSAAVILPKDDLFDYSSMKDSKKFHSKKKIEKTAEYIKQNALYWSVKYEDEKTIDRINILKATQWSMHKNINDILNRCYSEDNNYLLLIDGNYFLPYRLLHDSEIRKIDHMCIENGDNTYASIAAASILAKVERDKYIDELCEKHPDLKEKYSIHTNKGYGAAKHIDGIKKYGITQWHRKSFGICKSFVNSTESISSDEFVDSYID
jgi:ribonuclease HII